MASSNTSILTFMAGLASPVLVFCPRKSLTWKGDERCCQKLHSDEEKHIAGDVMHMHAKRCAGLPYVAMTRAFRVRLRCSRGQALLGPFKSPNKQSFAKLDSALSRFADEHRSTR